MSTVGRFNGSVFVGGNRWGAVVSGLGVVFGVIELAHIREMSDPVGIALKAVLPFVGAVGIVAAGYVLWTEQYLYEDVDVPRVFGWMVVGMVGMGVIFLWILAHQLIRGGEFHHAHFILTNNVIAGGLIGFVVGTYDARSQAYQRSIRRKRLKYDFLNRELRHHVLNSLQVILVNLDRLEAEATDPPTGVIASIRERGAEVVDRVESVRRIGQVFTEAREMPLDRRDLSAVLTDVVADVDGRHEAAVVSADVPEDVTVRADEFLPTVFENLLSNAIEHNDKDPPRVRVSLTVDEETAVVRIADNGPGLPEEHKDSLFAWEEPAGGEIGMGVGLAIVNVLIDRYGGEIWMEDNQPTGTVAYVELLRGDPA